MDGSLISPCDAKVYSISEITDLQNLLIVKNNPYNISSFLFGNNPSAPQLHLSPNNNYYQITLYLSPGDCHRYYSPAELTAAKRWHNIGLFHPVKPDFVATNPKTFLTNERVTLECVYSKARQSLFISFVSAFNVGDIQLKWDRDLKTNDKIKIRDLEVYQKTRLYKDYSEDFGKKHMFVEKNLLAYFKPTVPLSVKQINEDLEEFDLRDMIPLDRKDNLDESSFVEKYCNDASLDKKLRFNALNSFGETAMKELEAKMKLRQPVIGNVCEVKMSEHGVELNEREEMGMFKFGSTIVMIFAVDKEKEVKFNFKEGDTVKIGQRLFDI